MWEAIPLRPFEQEPIRSLVELARERFDTNLLQREVKIMMYSAAAYPLKLRAVTGVLPDIIVK